MDSFACYTDYEKRIAWRSRTWFRNQHRALLISPRTYLPYDWSITLDNTGSRTTLYQGDAAENELISAVSRALEEDSTGDIYAHTLINGELVVSKLREFLQATDGFDSWSAWLLSTNYDLVIVDSGNAAGDSWKYVYHPRVKAGMFCIETDL